MPTIQNAANSLAVIILLFTGCVCSCFGQHPVAVSSPFVVQQASDTSDPAQLLLIGKHRLGHFRFGVDSAATIESLPFAIEQAQIAFAGQISSKQVAVAGSIDQESGFLACYEMDGKSSWQKTVPHPIIALAVFENQLLAGDVEGIVYAFELVRGDMLWEKQLHTKMVTALTCFRDGTAASGDWAGKIVLWKTVDGNEITNFQQHRDRITALLAIESDTLPQRFSLVSAGRDGTVRLWYPKQNRLVRFIDLGQPVTSLAPVGELQVVAATNSGQLRVLDLSTARSIHAIDSGLNYVASIKLHKNDIFAISGEGPCHLVKLPN